MAGGVYRSDGELIQTLFEGRVGPETLGNIRYTASYEVLFFMPPKKKKKGENKASNLSVSNTVARVVTL